MPVDIQKVSYVKEMTLSSDGKDPDTVLADIARETDWEISDISQEVIGIWDNGDQETAEAMFYSLTGVEFETYIDQCIAQCGGQNE